MSASRTRYLIQEGVLSFNFGMDYKDWERFYEMFPDQGQLFEKPPDQWTKEEKDKMDARLLEEKALCKRLLSLSDEDFYREVDRLRKEREDATGV